MRQIKHGKNIIGRRVISGMMILLLLLQGMPMSVHADANSENMIYIRTTKDFLEFAKRCNDADYSVGLEVSLQSDLDLGTLPEDADFKGITSFSGIFRGNYYTISGLSFSEGGESIGLFCYVDQGAKIHDLRVKGTIDCSESKVVAGGIAGINAGTISGCYFKGTVSSQGEVGGIVGKNGSSGSIVRCTSAGAVDGLHKVGGIAGENRGVITDCTNGAAVNADTRWLDFEGDEELSLSATGIWSGIQEKLEEGTDFGGIAGWSNGVIASCTNKAVVGYQHAGKNVGGIVGRQSGQVIRGQNAGRVFGKQDVGGIIGQMEPQTVRENVEELSAKVAELHDLMDDMIGDMEQMGDDLHGDFKEINGTAREAGDTSDALLTEMRQVVEKNVDVINELARRIDYCTTHFGTSLGYLNQALNYGDGLLNDMDQLRNDLDIAEQMEDEEVDEAKNKRLVLQSGIGGKITADNVDPAEGATVTLKLEAATGYRLEKLLKTVYGKETEDVTGDILNNQYVISSMPKENVTMEAIYGFEGRYVLESNAGGDASLSKDQKTLQVMPMTSYETLSVRIRDEAGVLGEELFQGENEISLPELEKDGKIHTIYVQFARKEEAQQPDLPFINQEDGQVAVRVAAGVGGNVIADKLSAKGDDVIRVMTTSKDEYVLDTLQVNDGENLASQVVDGVYEYTIPQDQTEEVWITAGYKRVNLILESNVVGGKGSYAVSDGNVLLNLATDVGFYVKGCEVKNQEGAEIPYQKQNETGETYLFPISALEGKTGRIQVTFAKQSSHEAVKEAKEDLENQTEVIVDGVDTIAGLSERIRDILTDADGNNKNPEDLTEDEIKEAAELFVELAGCVTDTGVAAGNVFGDVNTIAKISGPYAQGALESADKTLDKISKDAHDMSKSLQAAGKELQGIVDYLNALEGLRAVNLSSNFDNNSQKLKTQLDTMADLLDRLEKHTYFHSEKLEEDMRALNEKMNEVLTLMVDKMDAMQSMANGEDVIIDVSAADDEGQNSSNASGCINKGVINGDRNVGGIVGTMGMEKTENQQEKKITVGSRYHAREKLLDCENQGFITVKTENGGCVVGNLELGYVQGCLAEGRVIGEEANYVGGIAGKSEGTIVSCSSLAVLDGGDYVGGIAGGATTVRDCYSMVTVLGAREWVGAIVGRQDYEEEEEDVTILRRMAKENMSGNYYCSSRLYGVNGVSIASVAQAVSYQELLTLENVPAAFSELGVTFIDADQNVIAKTELPYGADLTKLEYPQVKTASGEYMDWKGLTGDRLEGNLILQASEMTNVTILSGVVQGTNKPVALAEGTFTEEAKIQIEDYVGTVPGDAPVGSVCHFYKVKLENTSLKEDTVTRVRLLRVEEGAATIYRLDDGKWTKVSSKTMGSYEETQMQGAEAVFCVCTLKKVIDWKLVLLVAILVVIILALITVILKMIGKQRKQKRDRKRIMDEVEASWEDQGEE